MKVALLYTSEDMYSHECLYKKTNTLVGGNTIDSLWYYYMGDYAGIKAAIKMFVFDNETMTVELVREQILPLKKKIVINAKSAEKKDEDKLKKFKAVYGDDMGVTGFGLGPLFIQTVASQVQAADGAVQASSPQQW